MTGLRHMNGSLCDGLHTSEMTGDVITLSASGVTIFPPAGEAEVACALAPNVVVAQMVVKRFRVIHDLVTVDPLAFVAIVDRRLPGGGASVRRSVRLLKVCDRRIDLGRRRMGRL